jgi:hypothetical protein
MPLSLNFLMISVRNCSGTVYALLFNPELLCIKPMKTTILHLMNAVTCAGAVSLIAVPAKAQNLYFPGVNGNIVEMTTTGETNIIKGSDDFKGIDGLVFDSAGDLFIGTPLDIDEITNGMANVVHAFGDK